MEQCLETRLEIKMDPSIKTKMLDARIDEMAAREKIIDQLRALNFGARSTKLFCDRSLSYTPNETRQILAQLGLIITSEALTSGDPAIRMKIEKLKNWRRVRARIEGVPAYRVLTNRVLLAVASESPKTTEGLQGLKGFGRKSSDIYSGEILALLRN
jgi:ribonuclease D